MADGFSGDWAQAIVDQLSGRNVEFAPGLTPDSIRRIGTNTSRHVTSISVPTSARIEIEQR
jgi:hypothetical protein